MRRNLSYLLLALVLTALGGVFYFAKFNRLIRPKADTFDLGNGRYEKTWETAADFNQWSLTPNTIIDANGNLTLAPGKTYGQARVMYPTANDPDPTYTGKWIWDTVSSFDNAPGQVSFSFGGGDANCLAKNSEGYFIHPLGYTNNISMMVPYESLCLDIQFYTSAEKPTIPVVGKVNLNFHKESYQTCNNITNLCSSSGCTNQVTLSQANLIKSVNLATPFVWPATEPLVLSVCNELNSCAVFEPARNLDGAIISFVPQNNSLAGTTFNLNFNQQISLPNLSIESFIIPTGSQDD